ncbi:MAG: hypothetical protein BM564_11240 [Bacteroidetes bacterium MedPE-SWsnd-G2]|nr:MAG: hypothetical protein BM564_11240 [Bacteroidetes bacterium MedPE-SWsnd-G2]
MDKHQFIELLQQPGQINATQTLDVSTIVDRYPYFQAARAIYLKGLKNKESFKYNNELKVTAAYTADRSILFDFITSEGFNQNEISTQIKKNSAYLKEIEVEDESDISIHHKVEIDDTLKQQIEDTQGVLDPKLFEKISEEDSIKPESSTSDQEIPPDIQFEVEASEIEPQPEDQLELGKPLNFDKSETHSFSEWLKITSFKPIERDDSSTSNEVKIEEEPTIETKEVPTTKKERKLDLIDKFLSSSQKIKPVKDYTGSIDLSSSNTAPQDELMTETLARIYLEQKNFDKAIQSYKILSLKYPEKSGFFADQIKAVKQLQDNNTKSK